MDTKKAIRIPEGRMVSLLSWEWAFPASPPPVIWGDASLCVPRIGCWVACPFCPHGRATHLRLNQLDQHSHFVSESRPTDAKTRRQGGSLSVNSGVPQWPWCPDLTFPRQSFPASEPLDLPRSGLFAGPPGSSWLWLWLSELLSVVLTKTPDFYSHPTYREFPCFYCIITSF